MANLDYGYEVTIAQNATSNPAASSVTNQWQRQTFGNIIWEDILGATTDTYTIAREDRWAKIRLQQNLDGIKVHSNELQVTYDEWVEPPFDIEEIDVSEHGVGISYDSAVLGTNGRVYSLPTDSTYVFSYDPVTKTGRKFGNIPFAGGGHTMGGVLHPNGKIYAIPFQSGNILEIDTDTETIDSFGSLPLNSNAYSGCVLAPNGKIYGVPYDASKVVEIDVSTYSHRLIGSTISSTYRFNNGVLAPNGKIYCASRAPSNGGQILEINPDTGRTELIPAGSGGWFSGALAPNGKIYFLPNSTTKILILDPSTKTVTYTTIKRSAVNGEWGQAVLAPNGIIYAMMALGSEMLRVDTNTNKAEYIRVLDHTPGWRGGVLAPDGRIYSVPGYSSGTVMSMGVSSPESEGPVGSEYWTIPGLPDDKLDPRSPYTNKR